MYDLCGWNVLVFFLDCSQRLWYQSRGQLLYEALTTYDHHGIL